jgi:hypothetical protein
MHGSKLQVLKNKFTDLSCLINLYQLLLTHSEINGKARAIIRSLPFVDLR